MTGTRSQEYPSGVLHSPAPRATWPQSKVPQESKDSRACVRRVITTHIEGYEVCAFSPHHLSCLQKSTQECHSQLGRQLDSLSSQSDRDSGTRAIYPQFLNHLEDPMEQHKCRCLERSWRYGARSMPRYVCSTYGWELKIPPQTTWKLLESERK